MSTEPKTPNRFAETPRDKPVSDRTEHGNHERPGAQAHPRAAACWQPMRDPVMAWRAR